MLSVPLPNIPIVHSGRECQQHRETRATRKARLYLEPQEPPFGNCLANTRPSYAICRILRSHKLYLPNGLVAAHITLTVPVINRCRTPTFIISLIALTQMVRVSRCRRPAPSLSYMHHIVLEFLSNRNPKSACAFSSYQWKPSSKTVRVDLFRP
jgi:hypothetical protein